jgi:hypothetical protein
MLNKQSIALWYELRQRGYTLLRIEQGPSGEYTFTASNPGSGEDDIEDYDFRLNPLIERVAREALNRT